MFFSALKPTQYSGVADAIFPVAATVCHWSSSFDVEQQWQGMWSDIHVWQGQRSRDFHTIKYNLICTLFIFFIQHHFTITMQNF